ncbi:MAG: glycosyltransferase [Candidatus Omnitrophica bacterium]|nr:glycosyltransferase [Candidatus Omnitrophota bacterium]
MVYILLPAFNEAKNIEQIVSNIAAVLTQAKKQFRILVVNDGSTDNTAEIVSANIQKFPLELISFVQNQGVGQVFRQGIKTLCAKAQPEDILISMDCDQTHPANVLPRMIDAINSGCDLAIASRYHAQSTTVNLPFIRLIMSDAINWFLKVCFGIQGARDYSTFFRAYKIGLLQKAEEVYQDSFIEQGGFACMAEILIKLRRFNPNISEVPLTLRFDLRTGKSKMKVFDTIFGYLKLIVKEKLRR